MQQGRSLVDPQAGYDMANFSSYGEEKPPAVGAKPGAPGPGAPQLRLPGVDGRESMDEWRRSGGAQDEDDWTAEAIMHMNLASDMERRQNQGGN